MKTDRGTALVVVITIFQAEIFVICENVVHQSQEEQINENADGEIAGMKVTTVTGSVAHRRPTGHHDQQYLETRVPGRE